MNYILHPAAEAELLESISYYESKAPGIGKRLLAEFEQAMSSVCLSPKFYPVARKPNIRRALLPTYPFSIIFRQSGPEQIQVLAVAHQKRRPMYWISRVQ